MSDSSKPAGKPKPEIDLTKKAPSAAAPGDASGALPRSVQLALTVIYAQVGFAVLYAILAWPFQKQFRDAFIASNKKAKTPKVLCGSPRVKGCFDVSKSVTTFQIETAVSTLVVAFLIIMLTRRMRNGVRTARTLYIVASVVGGLIGFVSSPLSLLAAASTGAVVPRTVATLGAATCMVAIVMLFRPATQAFFDERSPRTGGGSPFGAMFRPRPAAARSPRAPQPTTGLRSSAASRAEGRLAKSKSRNDAEAIARGAALARSRAKESKSRRSDF